MAHAHGPLRVGVGGPVGSGKTALMDALCKLLRGRYEIAAITNDIYTKWDAEYLVRSGALVPERIAGVETGGCPHTAIREDASPISPPSPTRQKFPALDLVLIDQAATIRHVLAGACRPHHLRHRRRRGRQILERRTGHHPFGSPCDQQNRSRALCRGLARDDGARTAGTRGTRPFVFPTCAPARASRRSRASSRRRAGWRWRNDGRHCEERRDEAIRTPRSLHVDCSLGSQG
jgi:hypothetical protein